MYFTMANNSSERCNCVKLDDLDMDEKIMISSYSMFKKFNEIKNEGDEALMNILLEAIKEREKRALGEEIELGSIMVVKDAKKVFGNIEPNILCRV